MMPAGRPPRPLSERLLDQVNIVPSGCWLWTGYVGTGGYARIKVAPGVSDGIHRVAYELFVGPIPSGLVIDHLCRVRHRCNPDHLEPKTQRANLLAPGSLAQAASKASQTHCVRGHSLEDAYRYGNIRKCRPCHIHPDPQRKAS